MNKKVNKINRHAELYDLAVGRCLDKMDWDISDWLSDDEFEEYNNLNKEIVGWCMVCGDEPCSCEKGGVER